MGWFVNCSSVNFLGIELLVSTPEEAVETVLSAQITTGRAVHLANSFTMVMASKEPSLQDVLMCDIVLCDGVPLAQVLKYQDSAMQSVRGPSLMKDVLFASSENQKHFFLGGSLETLEQLLANIASNYPNVSIVGAHSPEYSPHWSDKIDTWVELIQESQATIVWVGLGTPKQDYVVHEIASRCVVTAMAVGAAFDFIAGTQPEAPGFLQGTGLEWVYRLFKEPRRLWKRYLVGNLQFILLATRERFR